MKTLFFILGMLATPAFAQTLTVPSIRACPEQFNTVQSVNGEAFQGDLHLPEASVDTLKGFQSCSSESVTIERASIACHEFLGYLEVCAVPSDLGQFLIVKDHVDGASVHVMPKALYSDLSFLNKSEFLVPNDSQCYVELLRLDSEEPGSRDHRNLWVDLTRSYRDMRQATSLALRALPKVLDLSCPMTFEKASITPDSCVVLNGVQTCFVNGHSGYYISARGESRKLAVGFYRWD